MTAEPAESQRAQRLNVTVKPETYARLHEARNRRGIEINVSQVADAAINAELDRREKPGMAELVARLRVESDMRRGVPYERGHREGERWARKVACWAEICRYAISFQERDVRVDRMEDVRDGYRGMWTEFVGDFLAPTDYASQEMEAPVYRDEDGDRVEDPGLCEQHWRGWLAAVKEIFEVVRLELAPIEPPPAPSKPTSPPPVAPVQVRDVDPDDIPF